MPLPGDDLTYAMQCDIKPLLFGDTVPRQRLTVYASGTVLGSFELTAWSTIVVPLPNAMTRGARTVRLTLLHPDAGRPCDHAAVDDSRVLALCFRSAALVEAASGDIQPDQPALHGVIAGGITAQRIAEIARKLPSLRGRVVVRFVDRTNARAAGGPGLEAPQPIRFCWLDISAGAEATQEDLINRCRRAAPSGPSIRRRFSRCGRSRRPTRGPNRNRASTIRPATPRRPACDPAGRHGHAGRDALSHARNGSAAGCHRS